MIDNEKENGNPNIPPKAISGSLEIDGSSSDDIPVAYWRREKPRRAGSGRKGHSPEQTHVAARGLLHLSRMR